MQKRFNSIASAMELSLFCMKSLIYSDTHDGYNGLKDKRSIST